MSEPRIPPGPSAYAIGMICSRAMELVAVRALLDEEYGRPIDLPRWDHNQYILGRIGVHHVVIAAFSQSGYGTSVSATVLRGLQQSFPAIRIVIVVGIGGGVLSGRHDIRLGDVVVGASRDGATQIYRYDLGKLSSTHLSTSASQEHLPQNVITAISALNTLSPNLGKQLEQSILVATEKQPALARKYKRPDASTDKLYRDTASDQEDERSVELPRPSSGDSDGVPKVHFGGIASGTTVVKDAKIRDQLAAQSNVIAFEMESADWPPEGFPSLVVRGISDYADSHKTSDWQAYAAMTAAAYAKELLKRLPKFNIDTLEAHEVGGKSESTLAISHGANEVGLLQTVLTVRSHRTR